MKSPKLSGAYHTKKTFFVISYPIVEQYEERELVGDVFTNPTHAKEWVEVNQKNFDGELLIHSAKLTGVIKMSPQLVEYET